jgi:hypothetical protein
LHAFVQLRLELDKCQEQVNTQCDPDLSQHCILASTDERFHLQILFDPFKKQLHLPAGLVDIGNSLGSQLEIIGQKNVVSAGLRISVTDTA